jgi:uracil-DNA glycosylase family protein
MSPSLPEDELREESAGQQRLSQQRLTMPVGRQEETSEIGSEQGSASALIPDSPTLPKLREAAASCRACELWTRGTQTVFGEGGRRAVVMFVGEQPGDKEDLAGRPFVGPAGQLLDRALSKAGLDRDQAYVTNVVKHFKWQRRGKRRIHEKPNSVEIGACRPWLEAEIALIKPKVIVCLGATAAQALLGKQFRVTQQRGQLIPSSLAPFVMATVHPSSILRAPDEETRQSETDQFVADLMSVTQVLGEHRLGARPDLA